MDEQSTKSDEEYDDLAMRDDLENGYWSDDDEDRRGGDKQKSADSGAAGEGSAEKYQQNLELFLRSNSHTSPFSEPKIARRRRARSETSQLYSRSLQSPRELGNRGPLCGGLILS